MKRTLAASVIAVTLSVSATSLADSTSPATSAAPAANAPAPASAAPSAAPAPAPAPPAPARAVAPPAASSELPLRNPQPLTLAPEPSGSSWGYKLLFAAAVVAAGVIAYRKRRARAGEDRRTAVKVIGKTSMGLRGELALVEVGGMRLLVGVTPSSMQTLAVLPDDIDAAGEPATKPEEKTVEPGFRSRSLLAELEGAVSRSSSKVPAAAFSAARYEKASRRNEDEEDAPESAPQPARERRRPARPRSTASAGVESAVEGQARGIAFALRGSK